MSSSTLFEKIKFFLCFKPKCNFFVHIIFINYPHIGANTKLLHVKDFYCRYFSIQEDLKAVVMYIFIIFKIFCIHDSFFLCFSSSLLSNSTYAYNFFYQIHHPMPTTSSLIHSTIFCHNCVYSFLTHLSFLSTACRFTGRVIYKIIDSFWRPIFLKADCFS